MSSTKRYRIVVLDDDHVSRERFKTVIISAGYIPFCFEKINICLDNLVSLDPNLIILGSPNEQKAYRFVHAVTLMGITAPVLIISTLTPIKQFIDSNLYIENIVIKPDFVAADIEPIIQNSNHPNRIVDVSFDYPIIIGNTVDIVQIRKLIPELSNSRERILIVGEPGSGRELLARSIHSYNHIQNGRFIKINPEAIPNYLPDGDWWGFSNSELVKADGNSCESEGILRQTFFFNDIDLLSPHLQNSLFHILQMVDRQASNMLPDCKCRVCVIGSASSRLNELVNAGLFRKDLYFRLNVISCIVPPLRRRRTDIPLITDFLADLFCLQTNKTFIDISDKTKDILTNCTWPGNVNELKKAVEKIVSTNDEKSVVSSLSKASATNEAMCSDTTIENIYALAELKDIKNYISDLTNISLKDICSEFMARTEKKLMVTALDRTGWNRKKAAMILDISYKSLLNKMKLYRLA